MSKEDIEAFSSNPLVKLMNEYLIEVEPSDLMDENMPFSLSAHPLSKHRVAVGMFGHASDSTFPDVVGVSWRGRQKLCSIFEKGNLRTI